MGPVPHWGKWVEIVQKFEFSEVSSTYTNGRKTTYLYEAIFLVNESLTACISNHTGRNFIGISVISELPAFRIAQSLSSWDISRRRGIGRTVFIKYHSALENIKTT